MGDRKRDEPREDAGADLSASRRVAAGPFRLDVPREGSTPDSSRDIVRRYKRRLGALAVGKREVADPDASVRVVPKRVASPSAAPLPARRGLGLGLRSGGAVEPPDDEDDDES